MRFKIPNIVIVFSNHEPNTKELSKDRWEILQIVKAGLKDITISIWKSQHGDRICENNYKKNKNDNDNYDI